ncbi:PF10977 family protein [Bacteriovorax sp. Seq25_V]|nr:PF10977 family protein [Bacteriovorax sp. Seq25_V]
MKTRLEDGLAMYQLPLGDSLVDMNELVGKKISMKFDGMINCIATGEKITKSYGQGYSYKAFITLPECDTCIIKPELCHFAKGTCRDPKWGKEHCFIPHYIYLAVSSDLKVGITRHTQVPTRWIDQGASYALPILKVEDRKTSGEIEVEIARFYKDKTNWRKMLQGNVPEIDLFDKREEVFEDLADVLDSFDVEDLEEEITTIKYPVLEYPTKVTSLGFDKKPIVEGTLVGIKGQYLILDTGVINMRKHQGYEIEFKAFS